MNKLRDELKSLNETREKAHQDTAAQLEAATKRVEELEHQSRTVNDTVQVENAELKSKIEELRIVVNDKTQVEETSKAKDEEILKSECILLLQPTLILLQSRKRCKTSPRSVMMREIHRRRARAWMKGVSGVFEGGMLPTNDPLQASRNLRNS